MCCWGVYQMNRMRLGSVHVLLLIIRCTASAMARLALMTSRK